MFIASGPLKSIGNVPQTGPGFVTNHVPIREEQPHIREGYWDGTLGIGDLRDTF